MGIGSLARLIRSCRSPSVVDLTPTATSARASLSRAEP